MSDNLPVKAPENPNGDFTLKDLEKIEKFKESGMIGLHTLKDTDCERCMSLYMDGKSYRQIANITKIDRVVIMFLSRKFNWGEMKKDYLEELQATLKEKVTESKLQSQEFLLHLTLAYQKKIGRDVDKYLRTDNVEFINAVDNKDLSSLMKIIETLHRLNSESFGSNTDKSLVSLNGMAEGMTITKTGVNSVEITPKGPSPFASKLKQFAELKREEERAKTPPSKPVRDIVIEKEQPIKPESSKNEEDPS